MKVFYNKDPRLLTGYVKVAGFYIPFDRINLSQTAQENWDKTIGNFNDGDIVEVEGDFSPNVQNSNQSFSHLGYITGLNLDYISSIAKIRNGNETNVNFGGKVFLDLAQTRVYFDGYDTSSFRDNLQNITIVATDSASKEYKTQTNQDGYFQFYDLPVGKYTLKIDPYTLKPIYKNKSIDRGEINGQGLRQIEIYLNGSNKSVEMIPAFRLYFFMAS